MLISLFAVLLLAACAAGPNELANTPAAGGNVAGFWLGLWHGIIFPIAFIISLFNRNIQFYEVHNNGLWYNIGFFIGAAGSLGGSSGGAARSRRARAKDSGAE
jgi:hypothetical protein